MQCLVLAGGLGTRMLPRTEAVPKSLLPVAGEPFVHWQLTWLADEGIGEVVFSIGHLGAMIREYVGDGRRWGLSVQYVDEGPELRGTGGAVELAAAEVLHENFLVLYGDSYLTVDLGKVQAAFAAGTQSALMTVYRNDGRWDRSNAAVHDGLVTLYDKRPDRHVTEMCWIDYGLLAFRRSLFTTGEPLGAPPDRTGPWDLGELCSALSSAGELSAFPVTDRFYEIGSPSGCAELEQVLTSGPGRRRGGGSGRHRRP